MNKKTLISVAFLVVISIGKMKAQGPAHLQVYKSTCNPGVEWSGWVNQPRPYFYFDFMAPYVTSEVTVTNVPYGGTYTQVYSINSGNFCNQWSEAYPLATGRYIWNVRVYFNAGGPIGWTWSQTTWGVEFDVDVTPPNPPVVTESHCGGNPSGWPLWTIHTSPYFTWSNPGDAGSGVCFYQVSVNGGGWSTVDNNWHPTYEGHVIFDFRSVDYASIPSSAYRIYVRIDNSAPPAPSVTEFHCGIPGVWTAHNTPSFAWSPVFDSGFPSNGSGINRYEVSINNGEWSTVSSGWHPTYGTGQYTFRFRTIDNVGLDSGFDTKVVYIDDSPPNPPIVTEQHCSGSTSENPPWSSHTSPSFTWSNPGDAGSGILPNGYQVSVNSGDWTTVISGWEPEYGNGAYTFDFRSIDRVGNISTSYRVYVRIHTSTKIYVKHNATGGNNGTSWTDAYTDLQLAFSTALQNDTIWAAAGTYRPSVDKTGNGSPTDPRTKTFQLVSNVTVFGGFAGTETRLKDRNPVTNVTILSGDIGTQGDNSDNCYSVVRSVNNSYLNGFTITGGNGNVNTSTDTYLGGGLANDHNSYVRIQDCIFKNNFANCGGAVGNYFCGDSIIFMNCKFLQNSGINGGAIGNWDTRAYITNCIFAGNSTSTTSSYGAAIFSWGALSTPQITNCTVYNNTDESSRGAIHDRAAASKVTNCIIWGNNSNDIVNSSGGVCNVTYSCIEQADYAGSNGNISSNPQFIDAANGDFRLTSGSLCIDAGNGSAAPKFDLEGNPRIDDPNVANTGTGDPVYSDIGAYESMLPTSIEYSQTEFLKIYPNPSNGVFSIEGSDIQQIEIYNMYGTLVYSRRNNLTRVINLGHQPTGVYLVKLRVGGKLVIKTIIVN